MNTPNAAFLLSQHAAMYRILMEAYYKAINAGVAWDEPAMMETYAKAGYHMDKVTQYS